MSLGNKTFGYNIENIQERIIVGVMVWLKKFIKSPLIGFQLAENSRTWGKERADMSLRLNEAEHGFGRSGGMVLHDYPVYVSEQRPKYTVGSLDFMVAQFS